MGLLGGLFMLAVLGGGLVGYVAYLKFSAGLPDYDSLLNYQPRMMSRVYAGDSRLLAELATERRIFVPASAIPDIVKHAFISAEDQNFLTHPGVDPIAILRAGITDLMHFGQGRRPIGASTITQQVAKNMLLDNSVSIARKVREALLAMRIERSLSKQRILELYLNEIYLGLQAYGVASAAQAYFDKPLDQLTLPEAAFLAALPKAPNNYNPFRFPEAARARRNWVLDRMAEDGVITAAQATAAKATAIAPAPFHRPDTLPGADYFAEEVRRELIAKFGADETTQGGLMVHTSLDPTLQAAADRALHDGLMNYDRRMGGWRGPVAHMDATPDLRTGWAAALAKQARPPGMLATWQLAAVLEAGDGEAKLGVLEPGATPADAPKPRVLPMLMSDLAWARPLTKDKTLGPAPRRTSDVLKPGDVVMAELLPATPAAGKAPARPARLTLRQIPKVQGALVSIDATTGRVLALAGGWSFEMSQFDRATQALRQPGSSFKPMVYLAAMQAGISPSQRFMDAPFVVNLGAAGKWRPGNYEQTFGGPTPLRVALEKSLNLVTIRVANKVGMEAVKRNAVAFHVVDDMPLVLPASLGAVETTVLRQAAAYAALAEGGREVLPTLIDSVQDRYGKVLWRAPAMSCQGCDDPTRLPQLTDERKRIADADSVFQVVTMMQGVMTRGTGALVGKGLGRELAGKTGTTQDFTDNWFVGFSPAIATAVWVGFDNPATLGPNQDGARNAGPIWHEFMATALKHQPDLKFIPPPGVTLAQWDSGSGMVTDAFKPGEVPGASEAVVGVPASATDAEGASTAAPHPAAAGVDSGLGGLY
ncbi:MAG: penicillin-binding protein [Rhodospirillales bacterium 70-18]|nr:MAG: penicillin-binding protein [Rhodospirillales bacterium 70-18]